MKKIALLLLITLPALSQDQPLVMRSNTEGLSIGIHLNSLGWSSDFFTVLDEEESSGFGAGIELGYGITQRFELIGRFDFSSLALQNDWEYFTFTNTELLARFNPGSTTKKLRPYVELGAGSQAIAVSPIFLNGDIVDYEVSGISFNYGAGLNYYLNRNLLVTLNLAGATGSMSSFLINNSPINEQPDVSNLRLKAGIRFYFKDL